MVPFLAPLYALSAVLLFGMAAFILHRDPRASLNRTFALGCLSLFLWLATLYLFGRETEPGMLTALGRANFASIALAVFVGYRFMEELTGQPPISWPYLEVGTGALVALTLVTRLVDQAEILEGGQHVTRPGILFALFALHVVTYGGGAVARAFLSRRAASRRLQAQLSVIGLGLAVTVTVSVLTGLVLPYGYHFFALEEVGALSSLALIASIAYGIVAQRLFDVKVVVKKTIVFAVLVAVVEKVYTRLISGVVGAIPGAEQSPAIREAVSLGTVVFIAASFNPIKKWLEATLDRLLYRRRRHAPR